MRAATSRECWQWNTHTHTDTHLFFCQKKRREKKQKTNLSCNNNSRHATPFRMSYDRLLSSLSAGCDAMRLCSACHLPHMPHAAWLHDCMPHTACQMCRIAPLPHPAPPSAMPMWIGGAVVIWGFRIVVDRLLIFAIVLHAPQKALCIVEALWQEACSLSGNCYCYCCYLCCRRRWSCRWCSMKCAMRLYCQ